MNMNPLRMSRPSRQTISTFAFTLILAVIVAATYAPAAQAQWTVIDPAHIAKTIWNGKKLVDQVANQKRQIENDIIMLKRLPHPPWRTIQARIDELDEVMRAGSALSYSMDNLAREFGITFPGFQDYANWSEERRVQLSRTLGTHVNVMLSLQRQGQQFQSSQEELRAIKDAMGAAEGQTSTMEVGNTLSAFTAEELILIRQLLAAQANAQAVQSAYQINREAQEMAHIQRIYDEMAGYAHPEGRGYSGILSQDNR